jgi:hypothetical protein
MTEVYLQLRYDEYKHFEDQMRRFSELETTHTTANEGFYHKAFRVQIGDLLLEIQGPFVKRPLMPEDGIPDFARRSAPTGITRGAALSPCRIETLHGPHAWSLKKDDESPGLWCPGVGGVEP